MQTKMKAVILCGGKGVRLRGSQTYIPKGMVRIGGKPMVWHVMKIFSLFGVTDFVLALGENGDLFRDYFLNYANYANDIRFKLATRQVEHLTRAQELDWTLTFAETGSSAHTGARLYRARHYVDSGSFFVAYSDCLSSVNLDKLWKYHRKQGLVATITGVKPPFRYGKFHIARGRVRKYFPSSQLVADQGQINGGFMVFEQPIFDYLSAYNECTLEDEVFSKLVSKAKLAVYAHDGFWQYLDTDREYEELDRLCRSNQQPWMLENA